MRKTSALPSTSIVKPFLVRKLIAYPFSVVYYFFFSGALLIFHPLQVIALRLGGWPVQKAVVDFLNFLLLRCLNLLGNRVKVHFEAKDFPQDRTLIFASNHQSTCDIPPLIWYLRRYSPRFVAKKELGKGLPSISFHLREGGNVLIDRKDPTGSLEAIAKFAQRVYEKRWSVIIFPEGTRTRNGQPKKFQRGGLTTLLQQLPDALLVPISISHSWKLAQWNYFPMPVGVQLEVRIQKPIDPREFTQEEVFDLLEEAVKKEIRN